MNRTLLALSFAAVLSSCGLSVSPDPYAPGSQSDDPTDSVDSAQSSPQPGLCAGVVCSPGRVCIAGSCECGPGDQPCLPQMCGGIANLPCGEGEVCVDDPSDSCDPKHGGVDCGGVCVDKPRPQMCGGIANIPCHDPAQMCIDDPDDTCYPKGGGVDCSGICVNKPVVSSSGDAGTTPHPDAGLTWSNGSPDAGVDELQHCGGFGNRPCRWGFICVDDPTDRCRPDAGGADCPGVCVVTR